MTQLGIIPSFQFSDDPAVNYKINPFLPGPPQLLIQPPPATTQGLGLSLVGITLPAWAIVLGLGAGAYYFWKKKGHKRGRR